ncbi:MAG: N-acylglucosamine-6-phosphate 2-epimerase [Granulosicoccus sp.]|jgi:N-acylglucosamine-6-phosphate 2-epimerase
MGSLDKLKRALVVSCQPIPGSPMDTVDIVVAMARTAELSGAGAVRIEGVNNVAAVKKVLKIPVIGIVKRIDPATPVVITPTLADVDGLIAAGADIVALDATARPRPVDVDILVKKIQAANKFTMADCATFSDGEAALYLGCDFIGITLSGYTLETGPCGEEPDFDLLRKFARITAQTDALVMAEGRFNTPLLAASALKNGADCVTVGSAITRMEHVVGWFLDAMQDTVR